MKLSICLPVYNNKDLFELSFKYNLKIINDYQNDVEIIVSDNNSDQDIKSVINDANLEYPKIKIKYSKNNENIGLAKNFIKVVEKAIGEYCWIIGVDDFLTEYSLKTILDIINVNQDLSMIISNLSNINLTEITDINKINEKEFADHIKSNQIINPFGLKTSSGYYDKPDYFLDPKYGNVMFGSMMLIVFKRLLWNSVEKNKLCLNLKMNNLESFYPHTYIFFNSMFNSRVYYSSEPLVIVGDGLRSWFQTENFWLSNLPQNYMYIFLELVNLYRGSIEENTFNKINRYVGKLNGSLMLKYIYYKYILKFKIPNHDKIDLKRILSMYKFNLYFYTSILISVIPKYLKFILKKIVKKVKIVFNTL